MSVELSAKTSGGALTRRLWRRYRAAVEQRLMRGGGCSGQLGGAVARARTRASSVRALERKAQLMSAARRRAARRRRRQRKLSPHANDHRRYRARARSLFTSQLDFARLRAVGRREPKNLRRLHISRFCLILARDFN